MQISDLKPCPFCGSDRITVWNIRDGQQAVCKECKSTGSPTYHGKDGPECTREHAITAWNRRAAHTTDAEPCSGADDPEERCPVCGEAFVPEDICATDIEMGICHAACLEGSPIVDLNTGEPSDGPIDTYLYGSLLTAPSEPVAVKALEWTEIYDGTVRNASAETQIGCYEVFEAPVFVKGEWVTKAGWTSLRGGPENSTSSFEAAKAAAQADYEGRIRSALAAPVKGGADE